MNKPLIRQIDPCRIQATELEQSIWDDMDWEDFVRAAYHEKTIFRDGRPIREQYENG